MASRTEKELESLLNAIIEWAEEINYNAEYGGDPNIDVSNRMKQEVERIRSIPEGGTGSIPDNSKEADEVGA